MSVWVSIIYWLCFFVSGYYFIMYKMSDNVLLLLPSTNEEFSFYDVFWVIFVIMLVFKTCAIVYKIAQQSSMDVMLIDWEKPRKVAAMDEKESVITWRSIFIGNEFNEM